MSKDRRPSDVDDIVDALSKVQLFADLKKKDLQQIASMCRPEHFDTGDTIVAEGDSAGRFYLVADGTAEVLSNGNRVGEIGAGGSFGEIALIDRGPRTATVRATSEIHAWSVASFTLRPLLKEHPELSYRLLVAVCQMLRNAQHPLHT